MNKDKPKFRNGGFEYKLTNNFHEMLCMHNQVKRVSTEEEKKLYSKYRKKRQSSSKVV